MNDTSDAVGTLYRTLLMRRTGADRLRMGSEMFDAARALVRASLGNPHGTNTSPATKIGLFLRVYGREFDADTRARIVARLRQS